MDNHGKKLILGVDGGGSKVAVSGLDSAQAYSSWPTSPADVQYHCTLAGTGAAGELDWSTAKRNIAAAVRQLCESAGTQVSAIDTMVVALSGAGRPTEQQRVRSSLISELQLHEKTKLTIAGDIDPLVRFQFSANNNKPSVVVIVGTGSIVASTTDNHTLVRAGGWGPLLGDECSGWAFAREALRQLCDCMDQDLSVGNYTLLAQVSYEYVVERLRSSRTPIDRTAISLQIIQLAHNRHEAAKMAPLILDTVHGCAAQQANVFIAAQIETLVDKIEYVVARQALRGTRWTIALCGGLITHNVALQRDLLERCKGRNLDFSECWVIDPGTAALQMAIRQFRENC